MLTLMVDPKYKFVYIVMTYVGFDNVVALVVEYDQKLLLPLLIKIYKLSMIVIVKNLMHLVQGLEMNIFFAP